MSHEPTGPIGAARSSEDSSFASVLLDCVAKGVITVGPSRQILAFNEAAEHLLGLHAKDALSHSTAVLPPPLQAVIDQTLLTGQPAVRRRILLSRAGTEDLLQVTTTLAKEPAGGVLSVLAEFQSLSQAQSMAANLEHLDRLASVGILSAGVAHEIKNALVTVQTFVELLREKCDDPELVQLVSGEIRRIDTFVRQILRGATREEFHLAPLNAHSLLKDAVNLLRPQLRARSIHLDLSLSASLDRISGDERQLRHAFINLLMNALEAMTEAGHLAVSTEVIEVWERAHLRVTISDNGSGIRQDHLDRLFSPFFTTKKDGTGLGLAITRRIVEQHNGSITVESKAGEGTTFHVFLPLLRGE
jgi:two-component system, NtrC family, sensor histidine kinase HydH